MGVKFSHWDHEKDAELICLYKESKSLATCADRFGFSTSSMYRILKALGIIPSRSGWDPTKDTELLEFFKTHTGEECAVEFNSTRDIIYNRLQELNAPSKKRNLTEDILALYNAGNSINVITDKVKASYTTISDILKREKVKPHRKRSYWNLENDAELLKLYNESKAWTLRKLASHFEVPLDSIAYALQRLGAPNRLGKSQKTYRNSSSFYRKPHEFTSTVMRQSHEIHSNTCYWKTFCDANNLPCDCVDPKLSPYGTQGISYHHIKPIIIALKEGWDPTLISAVGNCAPIHTACHRAHHSELHEGLRDCYNFIRELPRKYKDPCKCGKRATQLTPFCRDCTVQVILRGDVSTLNLSPEGLHDLKEYYIHEGWLRRPGRSEYRWKHERDAELLEKFKELGYSRALSKHFDRPLHLLRLALKGLGVTPSVQDCPWPDHPVIKDLIAGSYDAEIKMAKSTERSWSTFLSKFDPDVIVYVQLQAYLLGLKVQLRALPSGQVRAAINRGEKDLDILKLSQQGYTYTDLAMLYSEMFDIDGFLLEYFVETLRVAISTRAVDSLGIHVKET